MKIDINNSEATACRRWAGCILFVMVIFTFITTYVVYGDELGIRSLFQSESIISFAKTSVMPLICYPIVVFARPKAAAIAMIILSSWEIILYIDSIASAHYILARFGVEIGGSIATVNTILIISIIASVMMIIAVGMSMKGKKGTALILICFANFLFKAIIMSYDIYDSIRNYDYISPVSITGFTPIIAFQDSFIAIGNMLLGLWLIGEPFEKKVKPVVYGYGGYQPNGFDPQYPNTQYDPNTSAYNYQQYGYYPQYDNVNSYETEVLTNTDYQADTAIISDTPQDTAQASFFTEAQTPNQDTAQSFSDSRSSVMVAADAIERYKKLLDIGAITEDEYNAKKAELLQ